MSDSENTTENKAESNTAEPAPYIKADKSQDNKAGSSKNNVVIPLVLLLVSAIVIIATFYEDEYKDMIAQTDPATDQLVSTSSTEIITAEVATPQEQANSVSIEQANDTEVTAQVSETTITPVTPVNEQQPAATTNIPAAKLVATTSTAENNTVPEASVEKTQEQSRNQTGKRPPYANRAAYEQARKEAMARRQEQTRKHNEMMMQRRQAYDKEMQARREKYEAAMKTYKEKRDKIAEEQKAIYQQYEQNRTEAMKKMEELRKELADMNKQMRQMMRDSQPQIKRDPRPPMNRDPRPQFR